VTGSKAMDSSFEGSPMDYPPPQYYAMVRLLGDLSSAAPEDNHAMQFQARARQILDFLSRAPPVPPTSGPAVRAEAHAEFLETLALAYRLASGVAQEPVAVKTQAARSLLVDALRAWEREYQGPIKKPPEDDGRL
jgi:hypothetical protein